MTARILIGDCLDLMPTLDAGSVDAIVTDPPYGLAFMGKAWDHGVPGVPFWQAALRVAKPGAHLVAFGGTRTYHRLACAIEDAGWEIRDCLTYLYGSGFPKSHDVSKAIDKAAGAPRERVRGVRSGVTKNCYAQDAWTKANADSVLDGTPLTDLARQWSGWGTALKPAWEPIILARKPLGGTVAANVEQHGTGALNIDGCRITVTDDDYARNAPGDRGHDQNRKRQADYRLTSGSASAIGRWPANVVLDEDAAAALDEVAPITGAAGAKNNIGREHAFMAPRKALRDDDWGDPLDERAGASRFFYTAKASRSEREAMEGGPTVAKPLNWSSGEQSPGTFQPPNTNRTARNHHPTVKPLDLMRWLVRLVTPTGGLILDPFCGSGTTGCAALAEGFRFIGMEREAEYAAIAEARLNASQPGLAL